MPIRIGALALQGDYAAHMAMLARVPDVEPCLVRDQAELGSVAGLIIPGGESTTIGKLLERTGLTAPIRERAGAGMPLFGTCAGMILMAREIVASDQPRLGLMDIEVERNAFGRQVDSFEADIRAELFGAEPLRGVFIRAPYVTRVGNGVDMLAQYEGRIVAVRQKCMLATAFHPELTPDTRVHQWFAQLCRDFAAARSEL